MYSPLADQIAGVLVICAMVTLGLTTRLFHTAFEVRQTRADSRLIVTQRHRYLWTLSGAAINLIVAFGPATYYGPGKVLSTLADLRSAFALFGWPITIAFALAAFVSPVVASLVLYEVWRRPAEMGRKAGPGHYRPTGWMRSGRSGTVQPVRTYSIDSTGPGHSDRLYVESGSLGEHSDRLIAGPTAVHRIYW